MAQPTANMNKEKNTAVADPKSSATTSVGASAQSTQQAQQTGGCSNESFKKQHKPEKRKAESARIRAKYPDRIPVIAEKNMKTDLPLIDKKKYLVPRDLTMGQFAYVIRKRIKLQPEKALFVFVNNKHLPPTAALMSAIDKEYRDPEDGFLYFTYSGESTFGGATE